MIDVLRALLDGWSAEPVPIVVAAAALAAYAAGARTLARAPAGGTPPPTPREWWCLCLGVAAILLALVSPLDRLALQLQWVHMDQHVLLLLVAPPLVMLARPVIVAAAAAPPRLRAALVGRDAGAQRSAARRGLLASTALVLFVGVLWVWHVPALYDLTLRDEFVHDVEHTTFLAVGLLFWNVAVPRGSSAAALGMVGRSVLVLAGLIGSWLLAVYIGYAPTVLFAYHGAGGLSALKDQQIAAGVMWVPGSIPFAVVIVALVARWFENDARPSAELAPTGARP